MKALHLTRAPIEQLATVAFRGNNDIAPPSLTKKLWRHGHEHNTRGNAYHLLPYSPSSLSGSVSFSNRAPLIWDYLPTDVRAASCRTSFKSLYLKLLPGSVLTNSRNEQSVTRSITFFLFLLLSSSPPFLFGFFLSSFSLLFSLLVGTLWGDYLSVG